MARIKLQMPKKLIASIPIPVRITDINYGNHLGNDSLVGLIHEARMQWLAKGGYSEMNLAGMGSIMSELQVVYKQQVYYGNNLVFHIAIGEITKVGFEVFYQILNQDKKEIALAKTGIVCFDYEKNKVAQIPSAFLSYLDVSS